jgi:ATP-dependent Clp protease ATP-binding subunit ClpB
LEVSDEVVSELADAGYDPMYGARPLKRSIQKRLIDPLASELLSMKFHPGDRIRAETSGDTIVFSVAQQGTEAA